ncbi:uncharacterized membrane protein YidH (DUF202 family) [Saccharothrix tamanrassetensis]|uniref:Uncharacterized membrane protein YidH (DUF202 family) n=1 Tax=Saccharothrix tamanrassetensis TaxID=1051531 RepID=A0A841CIH0_9PSEU|nr:hypothetical protein [Saccharothrix tamanrassetensis]MBB5958302.1 uncharacterized membrane protein YidH (DUF202 family) [Saccharothrix tamanrassetensis]
MNSPGWSVVGVGEAAVRWRPRKRSGRHARARPSPPSTSPGWVSAALGLIVLVALILLLLTYV